MFNVGWSHVNTFLGMWLKGIFISYISLPNFRYSEGNKAIQTTYIMEKLMPLCSVFVFILCNRLRPVMSQILELMLRQYMRFYPVMRRIYSISIIIPVSSVLNSRAWLITKERMNTSLYYRPGIKGALFLLLYLLFVLRQNYVNYRVRM